LVYEQEEIHVDRKDRVRHGSRVQSQNLFENVLEEGGRRVLEEREVRGVAGRRRMEEEGWGRMRRMGSRSCRVSLLVYKDQKEEEGRKGKEGIK
jgi:hypothetical protein